MGGLGGSHPSVAGWRLRPGQAGYFQLFAGAARRTRPRIAGPLSRSLREKIMLRTACLLLGLLVAGATHALAQPLPLPLPPFPLPTGTPEERAACQPDVQKFCEYALPDTMRVLHCLQANRTKISRACRTVLERHGQ